MKKILLFLAAAAFVVSCNRLAENEFEIEGKVDPSLNGKKVYLEKMGGMMGTTPVDTVQIADGKFLFKGTVTEPSLHFVQIEGTQGKAEIVLENGAIELDIDKDSIFKTVQSGTYNNEKLHDYYTDINKTRRKMMSFQKKNQAAMMAAYQSNDTVAMNKINKEYEAITKEMEGKSGSFIKDNPKAFISVLLVKQMFQMNKPAEEIKKVYDGLDAEVKKTKEGKEVADLLKKAQEQKTNKGNAAVGSPAPDFSAPDSEGKTVSLKQTLGKVTIIDFWASWCKPCRMENPNVVALYSEYNAKGLKIIGVSLDEDEIKWKDAIAADKLAWAQVSNLKGWKDPIAQLYGVQSIPATFILDANGKIVAKDLRGEQLKAKVKELLGA